MSNIVFSSLFSGSFFMDNFSNNFSPVLVHLLKWHYWWWFWFSFILTFYFFFLINNLIVSSGKLNSGFSNNSKWGDYFVCCLPFFWCISLLVNSLVLMGNREFFLDNSSFIIRIRGKQWYWLYKVDNLLGLNSSQFMGRSVILGVESRPDNILKTNHSLGFKFIQNESSYILLKPKNFILRSVKYSHYNNIIFSTNKNIRNNKNTFFSCVVNSDYFSINNHVQGPIKRFLGSSDVTHKSLRDFFSCGFVINKPFFSGLNYLYWSSYYEQLIPNFNLRLFMVDNSLVIPSSTPVTLVSNSFDVVHSWFIPGLGIKIDCVPGRSIHRRIFIEDYGIFLGQCAEICGRFHHHMPIKVVVTPKQVVNLLHV